MPNARTTELLEQQAPKDGANAVPWDNSDTPCYAFHINGASGLIDLEYDDGSTESFYALQGVTYGHKVKSFKNTGTTPATTYYRRDGI
jgi:hypothetical protein